jgi:hypothetical protein
MARSRNAGRRRAAKIATATAVAGAATAGAVVLARRRSGATGGVTWTSGGEQQRAPEPEIWTCACGTAFRVAGAGRHQVLWLADAPEDEPVLGDHCPSCDRPLPGSGDAAELTSDTTSAAGGGG